MINDVNWSQIISTIAISSFTSLIVVNVQSWYTSRKDKRNTIVSTLELFKAVLERDTYSLSGYITLLDEKPIAPTNIQLPLFRLNLYSSINDYVGVFKVDAVLAKHLMVHLYYRENLIDISLSHGLELNQIKGYLSDSMRLLSDIERMIEFKKESILDSLKRFLVKLTPTFLLQTRNHDT